MFMPSAALTRTSPARTGHCEILDLFDRKKINLIVNNKIRNVLLMEFMKKRKFLFTLSSGAVHDQDRNIRLVQT